MANLIRTRITLIWVILLGATFFSWEMGHGATNLGPQMTGAVILVTAFVKARFIMLDFMEIRNAPLLLRVMIEGWVIVICSVLITLLVTAGR